MSERLFQVWAVSDGRIVTFREFKTKHEALDAAGLAESTTEATDSPGAA
jgi:hypothetical protein